AGDKVALSDWRVSARVAVDQGRPSAPADPARDAALARPLQAARRSRARVRQAQARMGARTAARPWLGACPAARRLDDPRQALLRARPSASGAARHVVAYSPE